MYSQDEMKTMRPPGIVSGDMAVPNRIGDRYSRILVATAEAKHLTTALASTLVSVSVERR